MLSRPKAERIQARQRNRLFSTSNLRSMVTVARHLTGIPDFNLLRGAYQVEWIGSFMSDSLSWMLLRASDTENVRVGKASRRPGTNPFP